MQQRSPAFANLAFALIVVVGLGALARLQPVMGSAYPLNDGGLFARMAVDLHRAHYLLPSETTYNGASIPFAYPPLGLYLTAVTAALLGSSPSDVLRVLPAVVATLTVLAMFALSSELLRSRWRGVTAAAVFALLPRSYMWLIVGGGITRSLGLLFALLALFMGARAIRSGRKYDLAAAALLAGLTFLSHPQAAVFGGISLGVLAAFHASRLNPWLRLRRFVLIGVGAVAVSSPWIVAVVAVHGVDPLVSAGRTGTDLGAGVSTLFSLAFTDIGVVDVLTVVGILGLFLRIVRRQWMIPVWLLLTVLIDPRAGTTYVTVPLALSAVPVLGVLLDRVGVGTRAIGELEAVDIPTLVRRHAAAAAFLSLLMFMSLRTVSRAAVDSASPLFGLTSAEVAAMEWASANTPPEQQFAVVSGRDWSVDYVSEWFPVIAGRISVATVQGSEWNGYEAFIRRLSAHRQLQSCARETVTCIDTWTRAWGYSDAYVFIPKGRLGGPASPDDCCEALRETLAASDRWRLIHDDAGASIFAPST